jgi:mannose-6-phosphate isomerase
VTIQRVRGRAITKPWGRKDLSPWSAHTSDEDSVGEIWFDRAFHKSETDSLLLKLLFTSQPLSIQVHPGDAMARMIGLPNGKTEAWHVLAAEPDAKVALGLNAILTSAQLRESIKDGSIVDRVHWQNVKAGQTIFVPAGAIHAIGSGLVIAEIQQRSDATFRLFDFGRHRELQVELAVAAAMTGPTPDQDPPVRLTDARSLLVRDSHFILELLALPPTSRCQLEGGRETWLLIVDGNARIDHLNTSVGEAVFVQSQKVEIEAGTTGLKALVAYPGPEQTPSLFLGLDHGDNQLGDQTPHHVPHHRGIESVMTYDTWAGS